MVDRESFCSDYILLPTWKYLRGFHYMAMGPSKAAAHRALHRRFGDRKTMSGHNSAAMGLTKQRTKAMTACDPGLAEQYCAIADGLLYRRCMVEQVMLWLRSLDIHNSLLE